MYLVQNKDLWNKDNKYTDPRFDTEYAAKKKQEKIEEAQRIARELKGGKKDDYGTNQGQGTNVQVEVEKQADNQQQQSDAQLNRSRPISPTKKQDIDSVSDATHKTKQSRRSTLSKGSRTTDNSYLKQRLRDGCEMEKEVLKYKKE